VSHLTLARGGTAKVIDGFKLTSTELNLIRDIKNLPSSAILNPGQIAALSRNLDLVLYKVLPNAVDAGNTRAVKGALELISGARDSGGLFSRFRAELVNQIPGAQRRISEQLSALGL
jgi:hypothetical protein